MEALFSHLPPLDVVEKQGAVANHWRLLIREFTRARKKESAKSVLEEMNSNAKHLCSHHWLSVIFSLWGARTNGATTPCSAPRSILILEGTRSWRTKTKGTTSAMHCTTSAAGDLKHLLSAPQISLFLSDLRKRAIRQTSKIK